MSIGRNNQQNTLTENVLSGAIAGAVAGKTAALLIGFKEGVIGGTVGGILSQGFSYSLWKIGFSFTVSEVIALTSAALLDAGFLHHFGSNNGSAPIPYTSEENMAMHHVVFYSALALGLSGHALYKKYEPGFFQSISQHQKNLNQQAATIENKPPAKMS